VGGENLNKIKFTWAEKRGKKFEEKKKLADKARTAQNVAQIPADE
jgi:hypothetical protein